MRNSYLRYRSGDLESADPEDSQGLLISFLTQCQIAATTRSGIFRAPNLKPTLNRTEKIHQSKHRTPPDKRSTNLANPQRIHTPWRHIHDVFEFCFGTASCNGWHRLRCWSRK